MDSNQLTNTLAGVVLGATASQLTQAHNLKAHWDDHPEDRQVMILSWIALAAIVLIIFAAVRPAAE